MKKLLFILSAMLHIQATAVSVFAQDKVQHEYVDLGLSVKWGTINMGTTEMRPYGWYSNWTDAMAIDNSDGSRMATRAEWNELFNCCRWEWTERDNITGYLVTSNIEGYTDRSIFLPAAGWLKGGNIVKQTSFASYWSHDAGVQPLYESAYYLSMTSELAEWHVENRDAQYSVRMVMPMSGRELTNISLEKKELSIKQGSSTRLNVTMDGGKRNVNSACTWTSADESVVCVTDNGLIVGVKPGKCVIMANAYGKKAKCTVTVMPHEAEFVDLGLSVLWASCNLGADKPSDDGGYYAWAELEPKDCFYWDNYSHCTFDGTQIMDKYTIWYENVRNGDNLSHLEPMDDVAQVLSGGEWHIPTAADFRELTENCSCNLKTVNGVKGVEFRSNVTGFKDKSIFIPYSGCINGSETSGREREYYLWSSTVAQGLKSAYMTTDIELSEVHYGRGGTGLKPEINSIKLRYVGMNIRPVRSHPADKFTSLSLPAEHWDLSYGEIREMEVKMMPSGRTVNDENITWSSTDPSVAAVANGSLTAVGKGSCTITAQIEGRKVQMTVTVTLPMPDAVDLGLSVKWASANLGAKGPRDNGAYFAWGETSPKAGHYSIYNYKFYNPNGGGWTKYNYGDEWRNNYPLDCKENLDPEDDAAAVLLGGGWRMPTADEVWELRNKCTWTRVADTIESLDILLTKGYLITSNVPGYEGRSIFLPSAGSISDFPRIKPKEGEIVLGGGAYYGSSNQFVGLGDFDIIRFHGCPIRPVLDDSKGARPSIAPDPVKPLNHNAMVDLGLSVMWADCNVGADRPEELGARFAWGETTQKIYYARSNYKYMKYFEKANRYWYSKYINGANSGETYIDWKTRLEPEDDAALVNWGGKWRMPTKEEFTELYENCQWTEATINGISGFLATSKVPGYTSNSVFFPISDSVKPLSDGIYMTADLSSRSATNCVAFMMNYYEFGITDEVRLSGGRYDEWGSFWSKFHIGSINRATGTCIRAVCTK